jgi:hypothetical protein
MLSEAVTARARPRIRAFVLAATVVLAPSPALANHDPSKGDEYGTDWHYCNDPEYRDCTGNGSQDNPEEGEHFCSHSGAECQHYPPFTSREEAEENEKCAECGHGAHSGRCRDQGCQRHCDTNGCWNYEQDKRPNG